jgi:hypothetical protein
MGPGKGGKGKGKERKPLPTNIVPAPGKDAPALRFNWNSPILISPHNSKMVYFGGNHVFRSEDRGDHWIVLSPDLTRGKPGPSENTGNTLTTLAESPLKPGLLFAGSDDGRVHVSLDAGKTWQDLTDKLPLPRERWITRVECSHFYPGCVYLSAVRYRNNDRSPYVFKSSDYGASWQSLADNLPPGHPVHVIREDPRNKDLLYAGTEFGLFISGDGGATWHKQTQLPTVAVQDLLVHPRDRELVIGTHGRSIYVMDVAPLQDIAPPVLFSEAYLFDIKPALAYRPRNLHSLGTKNYAGENPAYGAGIYYYLKANAPAAPVIVVTDVHGKKVAELKGGKEAGLHRLQWKLTQGEPGKGGAGFGPFGFRPIPAGAYTVELHLGERVLRKEVQVQAEEQAEPARLASPAAK